MAIRRQVMVWDGPGGPFEGVIAYEDEVETPRPGVLVLPNFLGQKEADNVTAERLAGMGYVALAADVFGQGKRKGRDSENVAEYMTELQNDRALLRDRLAAGLATLQGHGHVDAARCAAVGYCFGGKAALDMARSGQDVRGVVSFHGVYDRPSYDNVQPIAAKVLVCHGWDDPIGPPDAVVGLGQELTAAGADWQIHAYGGAGHAFTDHDAQPRPGFGYDEHADKRSWMAMSDFLADLFV